MSKQRLQQDVQLARGIIIGALGAAVGAIALLSAFPIKAPSALAPSADVTAAPLEAGSEAVAVDRILAESATAASRADEASQRAGQVLEQAQAAAAGRPTADIPDPNRPYFGGVASDRPSGVGLVRIRGGGLQAGEFLDGQRVGVGVDCASDSCTGVSYFGDFRGGVPAGLGRIRFADGGSYRGEVRNGAPEGFGVLTDPQGARHSGTFKAGRREGVIIVESPSGKRTAALWANGSETKTYALP